MARGKCKNSVFCVHFLFYYFVGTICGIFLFRCLLLQEPHWISAYSHATALKQDVTLLRYVLFVLLPSLFAAILIYVPGGSRLLPLLILIRGCVLSYSFAFRFSANGSVIDLILRGMASLTLFYYFCRKCYCIHNGRMLRSL